MTGFSFRNGSYVRNPASFENSENLYHPDTGFHDTPIVRRVAISEATCGEAFREYRRIEQHIWKEICDLPYKDGDSLSLVLLRPFQSPICRRIYDAVPTVFIITGNAEKVTERLCDMETTLRIEISCGRIQFGAPGRNSLHPMNMEWAERPHMGCSIGIQGVNKSGTMGIYLGGKKLRKVYGLTNAHVLFMGINDVIPCGEVYHANQPGGRELGVLVHPSYQDFLNHIQCLTAAVQELERENELYGGARKITSETLRRKQMELDVNRKKARYFGKPVCAHFGVEKRESDASSWLDVGICEVRKGRVGTNEYIWGAEEIPVGGISPIVPGQRVFKAGGRTQPSSSGVINEMVGNVRLKNCFSSADPPLVTKEYFVISEDSTHLMPISAAGDSGTVFAAEDDSVVAQMFGGALRELTRDGTTATYDITFVTPITRVLEYLSGVLGDELEVIDRRKPDWDDKMFEEVVEEADELVFEE